jgi:hypothetical protein
MNSKFGSKSDVIIMIVTLFVVAELDGVVLTIGGVIFTIGEEIY